MFFGSQITWCITPSLYIEKNCRIKECFFGWPNISSSSFARTPLSLSLEKWVYLLLFMSSRSFVSGKENWKKVLKKKAIEGKRLFETNRIERFRKWSTLIVFELYSLQHLDSWLGHKGKRTNSRVNHICSKKMFSWTKDVNTITTKIAPVDISFDVFNI